MQEKQQVIIPLSKTKLVLMLIGSIIFVLAGIWCITKPEKLSSHNIRYNSIEVFTAGGASIAFFGTCAFFITKKIFDNKPGLIINQDGITDNAGAAPAGLISWDDINGIKMLSVANQNFIIITLKNPDKYINLQTNFIKRRMMRLNLSNYGSPVNISANGLKSDSTSLYTTIVDSYNLYKSTAG